MSELKSIAVANQEFSVLSKANAIHREILRLAEQKEKFLEKPSSRKIINILSEAGSGYYSIKVKLSNKTIAECLQREIDQYLMALRELGYTL